METAGKTLDDKELSQAMKENGLGTPATRAQIIEVLLKREFIVRRGKTLEATDKGIRLIDVVHPEVKSPAMTGQWEAYLKRIERGQAQLTPFLHGIEQYVREVIGKVNAQAAAERTQSYVAPVSTGATGGRHGAGSPAYGRRALRHVNRGAEEVLWLRFVPNHAGRSLPYADGWTRRPAGDADRIGEVLVLSASGNRFGRDPRWLLARSSHSWRIRSRRCRRSGLRRSGSIRIATEPRPGKSVCAI
jgi:hypothetical protein